MIDPCMSIFGFLQAIGSKSNSGMARPHIVDLLTPQDKILGVGA